MRQRRRGADKRHVADLRHLQLMAWLREMVRAVGVTETGRRLGVSVRTVTRSLARGRLSGHMERMVERGIVAAEVDGPTQDSRKDELAERMDAQEARLDGIERRVGPGYDDVLARLERAAAGRETDGGGTGRAAARGRRRPEGPEAADGPVGSIRDLLVRAEPGEDDRETYGPAWPVVAEWRRLRAGHSHEGGSLSWLERQEAILELELVLLETFGMTLPPEIEPLRGFARRGQLTWRRTALGNTRRRRVRRELWRWVRRVLTLGMWWR